MEEKSHKIIRSTVGDIFILLIFASLVLLYIHYFKPSDTNNSSNTASNESADKNSGTSTESTDNFDYKGTSPDSNPSNNDSTESTAEDNYEQAQALSSSGKYQESLQYYDKAIAANPHIPAFYDSKAQTLVKMSRKQEALDVLTEGLKNNPDDESLKNTYEILQNF